MMMEQGGLEYEVQELNPPTKQLTFHQLQEQFWRWNIQIINFLLTHSAVQGLLLHPFKQF